MKKNILMAIAIMCSISIANAQTIGKKKNKKDLKTTTQTPMFTTELDTVSYSLGVSFANSVKNAGLDTINLVALNKAFNDVLSNQKLDIETQQADMILNQFFAKKQQEAGSKGRQAGEEFLAANAKKSGIVTTTSGLQYQIMTAGTGPKPLATDKVKTHYHGTLIDGKVFDSSVDRGEPAVFGVNQVIPGWVEALQMMPVGSKWRLFVPANLAYGDRGAGNDIKPGSALIFEVELISIEK